MIEHFVKRLELWERKYLLKGTRVTSKFSTLSSLVVYLCPHWWFWLVHSMSEKLQGDFLRVEGKGRLGNLSYDELYNLYCPERWDNWELETRWPLIKSCWVRNWKFLEESCGGKVQELGRDGDTGTVQFVLGRSLLKWNEEGLGSFPGLDLSINGEWAWDELLTWSLVFGRWFWEGRSLFQVLSTPMRQRTTSDLSVDADYRSLEGNLGTGLIVNWSFCNCVLEGMGVLWPNIL